MRIITTVATLHLHLNQLRKQGKSIGFSPTMGALHAGHSSLINEAKARKDYSVCSIFVNPTQFNQASDLQNYPRTLSDDVALLESLDNDLLFLPTVRSIYPATLKSIPDYDFGSLTQVLEGVYRPGHFTGVIQVMYRLLYLVQPNHLYMGLKDYQQQAIVRQLIEYAGLPTQLIPCPTVREEDGLAMSSRNKRLDAQQRNKAPLIYQVLQHAKAQTPHAIPTDIQTQAKHRLESEGFKVDYFEIVDSKTLLPITQFSDQSALACVAAWLGDVRLIDNLFLQ
ncbi:MAG: pantoate--beta-alanine ligase [Saprospiraceae bacterium]|nr:pantoate--beta-alanine ligase [Saprospiraceae bacterium]